jgi:hypothetical protein
VRYNGSHTSRIKSEEAAVNDPIDDLFELSEHNTLMYQRLKLAVKTFSIAF